MQTMEIVTRPIPRERLKEMAGRMFGNLVKAVVDVERRIMAIDAGLHSDQEALLIENGSEQKDLWGINLYPEFEDDRFVEFDSMINLRPSDGNTSRGVDSGETRALVVGIVKELVE